MGAFERRGEATADLAAKSWLLGNQRVTRMYQVNARTRMVAVSLASQVVRVLELVRTSRGWLPESVVACHARILREPATGHRCAPEVTSASGVRFSQVPVRRGPQLGIAEEVMLVRVSRCGVVLPGGRLLALQSDVWPVTTYTRSEESPTEGQVISIVVGRGAGQKFFPTEYEGTT